MLTRHISSTNQDTKDAPQVTDQFNKDVSEIRKFVDTIKTFFKDVGKLPEKVLNKVIHIARWSTNKTTVSDVIGRVSENMKTIESDLEEAVRHNDTALLKELKETTDKGINQLKMMPYVEKEINNRLAGLTKNPNLNPKAIIRDLSRYEKYEYGDYGMHPERAR